MSDSLKVVCGWCGKFLRGDPGSDRVSHGMCESCAEKWRADAKARKRNPVTRRKARLILHHGEVRGYALTPKQRRYFGARASGYAPNGIAASLWKGAKAGYHDYRATKLEAKAARHRSLAKLNPGRRTIPGRALEIRYLRSDGKRYFHPFEHPVKMIANRDGSVTLRGGKRIHADDGEPHFWERYGHGRHGKVRNPKRYRRRSRSYGGGGNAFWLYVGAALILYPMLTRNAYGVSTGGQAIIPQPSDAVWYSDPYQGGGGEYFVGSLPPGASPPWRLAAATEIGAMQAGLLSGYLAQAGGGLVAPAPGFTT